MLHLDCFFIYRLWLTLFTRLVPFVSYSVNKVISVIWIKTTILRRCLRVIWWVQLSKWESRLNQNWTKSLESRFHDYKKWWACHNSVITNAQPFFYWLALDLSQCIEQSAPTEVGLNFQNELFGWCDKYTQCIENIFVVFELTYSCTLEIFTV